MCKYWEGDGGYPVFDVGTARIGVAICYDRHFPEGMRALALSGAEVIVVPTATANMEERFRAVWEVEMQAAAVVRRQTEDKEEGGGRGFDGGESGVGGTRRPVL